MMKNNSWSPLAQDRLEVEPQELVERIPQLAKDEKYAQVVQNAWKNECPNDVATEKSESLPYVYQDIDGNDCFGRLIRRTRRATTPDGDDNINNKASSVPGIIFFHTAAGPHDIFLDWKANSLVTDTDIFPDDGGCVVLIADILSDDVGWSWDVDRTKYNKSRNKVFETKENSGDGVIRPNLQNKISAALEAIKGVPGVDSNRLAAMGWCLGGHCILEMSRMNNINPNNGMNAMITFHGVFDGMPPSQQLPPNKEDGCKILICNGEQDIFVPSLSLQNAIDTMKQRNHQVSLLNLAEAKHGFTNPAQGFNPNKAFGFNAEAAQTGWSSAKELLKSTLN